jgi:ankyrin repeat protein
MTARIINLRQRRKQKQRDADRRTGDANAASFGRSKAERDLTAAESDLAARRLDGHRIGTDDEAGDKSDER